VVKVGAVEWPTLAVWDDVRESGVRSVAASEQAACATGVGLTRMPAVPGSMREATAAAPSIRCVRRQQPRPRSMGASARAVG
jgi:hypothetical protein